MHKICINKVYLSYFLECAHSNRYTIKASLWLRKASPWFVRDQDLQHYFFDVGKASLFICVSTRFCLQMTHFYAAFTSTALSTRLKDIPIIRDNP
jgi:hypothetical protein